MVVFFRWALAYVLAVACSASLASLVQTQFNLARLRGLGESIDLYTQVAVSLYDLGSFAPTFAVIVALAFLPAFLVAAWLGNGRLRGFFTCLAMLAGLSSILLAIWTMNSVLPVTVIAASREFGGTLVLGLTGVVGGWVFARLTYRGN